MKKFIGILLALVMVFASIAASASDIKVLVNGQEVEFDQGPVIDGETVLVPLRFVFEKLGAIVSWHEDTQTIFSVIENDMVTLQIGNENMFTADNSIVLEKAPVIIGDRTLISSEVIEKGIGAEFVWDELNKTVTINK